MTGTRRLTDASVAEVVHAAVRGSVEQFFAHEPGVRSGDDPEDVHQARVATRRLRSDLRTFGHHLDPKWSDALRGELRWLGAEIGAVRDIDVLRDRLAGHAAALPDPERECAERILRRLIADRHGARDEMLDALDSERFAALRETLTRAAEAPRFASAADAARPAGEVLTSVVRKPWKRLAGAVAELDAEPRDKALHAVRIRAKRARYAAEAVVAVFGSPARRFAAACERLQDVLGDHQDAVVARVWLARTALECAPNEAYVAGMLAETERQCARDSRAAFPQAWAALDRPKLRAWM